MSRRILTVLIAVAAIAAAAAGYLYLNQGNVSPVAGVSIGGPIKLTAQDGTTFDSASLAGKPYAVFFGFTHCPEACPTTLSELSRVTDELGDQAKDFRVLFITVDPERDTPAVMKDYVSNFTANVIGLSGTPEEVAAVAKEYRVFYKKVPTSDGGYTMDHTAVTYLIDRTGQLQGIISYGEEHERFLDKIKRLLAG